EHLLNEANRTLKHRLMEGYQLQMNPAGAEDHQQHQHHMAYGVHHHQSPHQPPGNGAFFHPLDCEPTLQIGYQHDPGSVVTAAGPSSATNFMPGWLP
ncbi:hypothetical protein CRG98_024876, partial [Punica granatum]